jgi:hypothetical protein
VLFTKVNEMSRSCEYRRDENTHTKFYFKNLKGRHHMGEFGIDGRVKIR